MTHPLCRFTSDWVNDKTAVWERWFRPLNGTPCQILEIGSYEGRSACWFLDNMMSHPDSRLTCVDRWWKADHLRSFDLNISLSGKSNQVTRHTGLVMDILPSLKGSYDVVYIDADHIGKSVVLQAGWAFDKLKPGGYILFDDYKWTSPTVKIPPGPGIDAFLNLWQHDLTVVHKAYQVLIQKNQ